MRKLKSIHWREICWECALGEPNDFSISPGSIQLYVKMDWIKSEPIRINIGKNEVLKYEVTLLAYESKFGVLKQLYDLVFIFFNFFKLEKLVN